MLTTVYVCSKCGKELEDSHSGARAPKNCCYCQGVIVQKVVVTTITKSMQKRLGKGWRKVVEESKRNAK